MPKLKAVCASGTTSGWVGCPSFFEAQIILTQTLDAKYVAEGFGVFQVGFSVLLWSYLPCYSPIVAVVFTQGFSA